MTFCNCLIVNHKGSKWCGLSEDKVRRKGSLCEQKRKIWCEVWEQKNEKKFRVGG